ncbi:hypothetical protein PAGU2196_39710 [Pseudomonas sp. PAGU 2196]|uniref:TIR domain-containing protein n=1 Tax=Pseudomonas sp. PAGU 2196 TaxID=2793997 RepID=UPI001EDFBF74|nr:TIR domain-containing protein [Pseudomonas sp. PAGU 2196]GHS83137.1 hypothetical protein PAGU2196_39710 [Pseudomonas sp. PAGU 2196]
MKAFLSHSSNDKPFVEEVGRLLGRQHYFLDKHEFEIGQGFKEEIARCLASAETFVLFASRDALKSSWVSYEIDIAEDKRISGLLSDALVFLMGDVTHKDLPPWLTKGLVVSATSPSSVSRSIARILDKRLGASRSKYFFGRGTERDRISKALNPIASELPRLVTLWGLPGIGRKTLLEDVARSYLQYKDFVSLEVESGDELSDLLFKLAEEKEFWADITSLKALGDQIRSESIPEQEARLEKYLASSSDRSFLTLVDAGGLLTEDGDATGVCRSLVEAVSKDRGLYIGMIFRRMPGGLVGPQSAYAGVVCESVRALPSDDIERLLVKVLSERQIKFDAPQIKSLAEFVRGYPPAAYYAGELAAREGLDLLLGEPRPMIDFRSRVLAAQLNGVENKAPKGSVLEILAFYSPLPYAVIGECTGLSSSVLAAAIAELIHCSVLEVNDDGFYRVSEPLVESSQNLFDRWKTPHVKVAKALQTYVEEAGIERGGIDLLRSLYRAKQMARLGSDGDELSFPADLVKLTQDFYHQREYDRSIEIGEQATALRPDNVDALSFLVRAYAQMGDFKTAVEKAQKVRELGSIKEFYFLHGFIARLKSDIPEAIRNYEEALARGRKGVAINRELASCYFHSANFPKAKEYLIAAQGSSERKNRYVVDLLVIIATADGDEETARKALADLELVDKKGFYLHRASSVEFKFGSKVEATSLAREAVEHTTRPPFAMLSQRIKCEIAINDLEPAALHLREAEQRFNSTQRDSLLALRCKWELASGEVENADAYWRQIHNKEKPAIKALRREVVQGLIDQEREGSEEHQKLVAEFLDLTNAIGQVDWSTFTDAMD